MHTPSFLNIHLMKNAYLAAHRVLIQQWLTIRIDCHAADALHFFRNVSDLLDVFERGEVRTEPG